MTCKLVISEKDFACGVIYACARLIEMHDQPTMALEILKESGVNLKWADEYDKKFIRKAKRR